MSRGFIRISMSVISCLFLVFTMTPNASGAPTIIKAFDGVKMRLNGSATVTQGVLRLTPLKTDQAGSAFINNAFSLTGTTDFSTAFTFILPGGTDGADGLTFMLQNSSSGLSALGAGGGDLGYSLISPSIAVEFDTYWNDPPISDPSDNHVGINTDGNLTSVITSSSVPDLNSGYPVYVWIDYDSTVDSLEVFVGSSPTKPATPKLTQNYDLTSLGSMFYAGFSAATGGLANAHDIVSWYFSCNDTETDPIEVPIDIKPWSNPNGINPNDSGTTPVAILSTADFDATTVNPASVTFGPDDALAVSSSLQDVNGDGRRDIVLHFVTRETGIQCGDTSAEIEGTTFNCGPFYGEDSVKTTKCN